MPHVTFIHGIANKPEAKELLRLWRRALADGDEPLALSNRGVTTSLVYWADVLYPEPDPDIAAHEGLLENSPQAIDASGGAAAPVPETSEEAAFLTGLRTRLAGQADAAKVDETPPLLEQAAPAGSLERVPLPWFIKKPFLETFLRDVHHYLFNTEFSPRPGVTFRVQDEIRRRVLATLTAQEVSRPHILVSHSMGTVIAYDCLKRLPDCPPVDGLMTIGSPLGLDEVQDQLQPEWTRSNGFPHERLQGGWTNLFDRLDPVCGFDPALSNDFRQDGGGVIRDVAVVNEGAWRHSAGKYFRQAALRAELRRLLGL
jgi:hypothetical protein